MLKTYLCGPINGCTDEECKDWRELVKGYAIGETIDPMRRDYRGVEDEHTRQIVELDKVDVAACDVLLASVPKPSYGTAMEVFMAWTMGKYVILVFPDVEAIDNCSPWLSYHSHACFVNHLDAAVHIRNLS